MHSCLQISEIQEHIISHASRHTSVQLALTCRAFYDPAMDAIWEHVRDFAPLIGCMPQDVWMESVRHSGDEKFMNVSFRREPTPEEWLAFRKHAHRIRTFDTEGNFRRLARCADPDTLRAVSQHICDGEARGPLFPYLKQLSTRWFIDHKRGSKYAMILRCVSFLAGQSLCTFEVTTRGVACVDGVNAEDGFVGLAARSANIRQANLGSCPLRVASAMVMQLTGLEKVVAAMTIGVHTEAGTQMLKHLAGLMRPGLRSLRISCLDRDADPSRIPSELHFSGSSFISLVDLKLSGVAEGWIISFLDAVSMSRKLRILEVRPALAANYPYFDNMIAAVSTLTALETLTINICSDSIQLQRQTLDKLHTLQNLRDLSLYGFAQVLLTDSDLAALASTYPRLEQLDFTGPPPNGGDGESVTAVTLMGLAALRNARPSLRRISIDVSGILGPGISSCIPPNPQMLQPLELSIGGRSPPLSVRPSVAVTVLSALFPRLSKLECSWEGDYWPSVQAHLLELDASINEESKEESCD